MHRMRCPKSSNSCSTSSSSSCIESPISENEDEPKKIISTKNIKHNKPKRVRAKKITKNNIAAADNSAATSPKSRSSIYRGVTRHRWTGRYEAHLWDKTTWNSIQNKRGRQIYLGAYDNEEDAARTYDLAALKYWGPASILNFSLESYTKELEEMEKLTKEEYLASLRRRSSGFSRGVSKYRGVARHHHNGRWEARIGRVCGNKYLYLGTYSTQEEAAAAYDMAAIEFRGPNAVTNFDISNYANKLNKLVSPPDQPQVRHEEDQVHQVKLEINRIPLTKVQADQAQEHEHQEHNANQVFQTSSVPKLESSMDAIDSQAMAVMDPTTDEHDHPWDHLCLDTGFNILLIPDIPLGKESDQVFDYKGFEDDIECIFDGPFDDNDGLLIQDAMSTTASVCSNF